jgi:hypothetical protein
MQNFVCGHESGQTHDDAEMDRLFEEMVLRYGLK